MLTAIDHVLSTMARAWLLTLVFMLTVLIGGLDYLTGFQPSFAIFYLVPVVLGAWYADKKIGEITALLAFLLSLSAGLVNVYGGARGSQLFVLWNALTPLALYLVIVMLLDKLHERLRLEQRLARTDHLTGCLNAHAFMPMLQYHFDLASRDRQPITLAYVDLDDFKSVNDSHGHDEGDRVLKLVAHVWLASCRRTDLVARLGGDEFCILFPNTDQKGAASIITKGRQALTAAFLSEHVNITCSIGAITFPTEILNTKEAIKAADMLMYHAKNQGKNSTVFSLFDPAAADIRHPGPQTASR